MASREAFPPVSSNFELCPPQPRSSSADQVSASDAALFPEAAAFAMSSSIADDPSPEATALPDSRNPNAPPLLHARAQPPPPLGIPNPNPIPSYASTVQRRLARPRDIPAHDYDVLKPEVVEGRALLVLSPAFHQRQVRSFTHAIHGRLFLRKGDSPRFADDLKAELDTIWSPSHPWQVVPLGKGFFSINFSDADDLAVANKSPSWRLRTGFLRLQAWTPFFDPYKPNSSITQVWIRIFRLPLELWHPEVISGIARLVGVPILVDGQSAAAGVGHFARVLVEVDVSGTMPTSLDIQCGNHWFEVEFGYENLPYFCNICKVMGHATNACRKHLSATVTSTSRKVNGEDVANEGFSRVQGRKQSSKASWTKVQQPTSSTNAFAVLSRDESLWDDDMDILPEKDSVSQVFDAGKADTTLATSSGLQDPVTLEQELTGRQSISISEGRKAEGSHTGKPPRPYGPNSPHPKVFRTGGQAQSSSLGEDDNGANSHYVSFRKSSHGHIHAEQEDGRSSHSVLSVAVRRGTPRPSVDEKVSSFTDKVGNAISDGMQVQPFSISEDRSSAFSVMDKAAGQRWSEILDADNPLEGDGEPTLFP